MILHLLTWRTAHLISFASLKTYGFFSPLLLLADFRRYLQCNITFTLSLAVREAEQPSVLLAGITSANASAFDMASTSDVAFSFPVRGQEGGFRYLYARKSVLCHYSDYFTRST